MYSSCQILPLLLLSFVSGCFCPNVVVIGIMNNLRSKPDCKEIDPTSVKALEAVYWLIDHLHKFSQKNLKYEIDARNICRNLSVVPATIELINKYKDGPKKLIGIVTQSTSYEAIMISQFINSLPVDNQVIQVGVKETAIKLNDQKLYRNLFRILPDDRTQMKMICDVLVRIKWNYIALLHENDVYGRQGAELLTRFAREANIHIDATFVINTKNLDSLKFNSKVSGLVIIAQHSTVQRYFGKYDFTRKMSLFMSEAFSIDNKALQIQVYGAFLVVQRAFIENQKFEKHWKGLFKQVSPEITSNPYFAKMIEEVSQCSFTYVNNSCDMENAFRLISPKISLFEITESIATGVYAITSVFERIIEKTCPTGAAGCLFSEALKAFRQPIDFSFLKDKLGYERMDFRRAFNANGTLERPSNWVFYHLFYRKIDKSTGKFSFNEAGNYTSSGLNLKTVIIPGYDSKKEFQIESITCPAESYCKQKKKIPDYIYKEGDIIFVGIVPIHAEHKSKPDSCGSIRSISGISLSEAMLFTVKELNERRTHKYLFPGKKIGILILDSCDSDIVILKKLFALRRNDPAICGKGFNCSLILSKAMVFIGPLSSRVSHAVSKIITSLRAMQISYGSTSDTLSDRNTYPNFMRICTSDEQQIKAIIDLLVKFDWKYVSMIYANELYGTSFRDSFLSKIKEHDICVIRALPYDAKANLDQMLKLVRQRPEARVIILYLRSYQAKTFLNKFVKFLSKGEFIFIGSESWANKIKLGEVAEKIHGSFTLGLEIQENLDFKRYCKKRILNENNMDIWLQNFIERNCYMPLSLDKTSKTACPKTYTLDDTGMKSTWTPFVIDALTAAAIGLNKSIGQICRNGVVCPELFEKTKQVIENIKEVKLKKNGGDFKPFDDNGDGTSSYNIYEIHSDGAYVKVGLWSKINRISFNEDFKQPSWTTKCPIPKRCSECIYPVIKQPITRDTEKSYTAALVAFIVLLLLLIAIASVLKYCNYKNKHQIKRNNVIQPYAMETARRQMREEELYERYATGQRYRTSRQEETCVKEIHT